MEAAETALEREIDVPFGERLPSSRSFANRAVGCNVGTLTASRSAPLNVTFVSELA